MKLGSQMKIKNNIFLYCLLISFDASAGCDAYAGVLCNPYDFECIKENKQAPKIDDVSKSITELQKKRGIISQDTVIKGDIKIDAEIKNSSIPSQGGLENKK